MDFAAALRNAWSIVKLDRATMREVMASENSLVPALVILAIGGALTGVGTLNPMAIIMNVVLVPVVAFIWTGILHLLAGLFGGKGQYVGFFGGYGHGVGLVNWVGVVPLVGALVATVYGIVVAVFLVEENYGLPTGKAVAVVLIPVAFFCLCAVGLAVMFGASMMALMGAAAAAE